MGRSSGAPTLLRSMSTTQELDWVVEIGLMVWCGDSVMWCGGSVVWCGGNVVWWKEGGLIM